MQVTSTTVIALQVASDCVAIQAVSRGVGDVTRAVGEVFEQIDRGGATPDADREVAWAPNPGAVPPFDCECVEPQFWTYRKAEMHVCGRDDFGPDAI